MIKSPYATKLTREIAAGKSHPTVDPTNGIARDKPRRKRLWEQRKAQQQARVRLMGTGLLD